MARLYKMPDVVLKVAPKAAESLVGICANTLDAPKNAFLDKQGRIIATVSQQRVSDDEQWLVVTPFALTALQQHLEKMFFFSETKVVQGSEQVYWDLEGNAAPIISPVPLTATVTESEFLSFRLDHAIPLHGVDYTNEMLLNINDAAYVSYDKGCFLGQEIVARVHYKSHPPRKLVVALESEVPVDLRGSMTSLQDDPQTTSRRGFVFLSNKFTKVS